RLFFFAARLYFHRNLFAAVRLFHLYGGRLLRARRGFAGAAIFRLAPVVLPVPGAGGGDAFVGRRAARRDAGAVADDAHYRLAGDRGKVFGLVVVPGTGAGVDVPDGDYGQLPGQTG